MGIVQQILGALDTEGDLTIVPTGAAVGRHVPRLVAAGSAGGRPQFRLLGEPGHAYTIQLSTNLVNWTVLTNFVSATGTNQFSDSSAPNFSGRFYRSVSP